MSYTPLPKDYSIKVKEVNLTSAQILSLNSSPVTIVSAPGGGKAVFPIAWFIEYTHVTTAYANPTFNLGWNSANASVSLTNILNSVSSTIRHAVPGNNTFPLDNTPFTIYAPSTNPTTGDGTLRVIMVYTIVSI